MSPVTFWQKISAALFLILTIAVWLYFKLALAVDSGQKYHTYFKATVRGLAPSSLVCWDGIRVGKVTKISNDFAKKRVRIDFVITRENLQIFTAHTKENGEKEEGTKASLRTNYITGLQYINLSGGILSKDKTNILKEDSELNSEDPINWNEKINKTSGELAKIMTKVQLIFSQKNLDNISSIIKNIETLTTNLNNEIFKEGPEGLVQKTTRILDHVETLLGKDTQENVQKILANAKELSDPKKLALDKLSQKLQTQLDEIASATKTLLQNLNKTIDSKGEKPDVASTLLQVDGILKSNSESLKKMIANLAKITSLIKKELAALLREGNKAMVGLSYFAQKELKRTNREVQQTLKDLSDVLKMLKNTPNALIFGSRGGRR